MFYKMYRRWWRGVADDAVAYALQVMKLNNVQYFWFWVDYFEQKAFQKTKL